VKAQTTFAKSKTLERKKVEGGKPEPKRIHWKKDSSSNRREISEEFVLQTGPWKILERQMGEKSYAYL